MLLSLTLCFILSQCASPKIFVYATRVHATHFMTVLHAPSVLWFVLCRMEVVFILKIIANS